MARETEDGDIGTSRRRLKIPDDNGGQRCNFDGLNVHIEARISEYSMKIQTEAEKST